MRKLIVGLVAITCFALVPMAASADMLSMNDSELGVITGQLGVTATVSELQASASVQPSSVIALGGLLGLDITTEILITAGLDPDAGVIVAGIELMPTSDGLLNMGLDINDLGIDVAPIDATLSVILPLITHVGAIAVGIDDLVVDIDVTL